MAPTIPRLASGTFVRDHEFEDLFARYFVPHSAAREVGEDFNPLDDFRGSYWLAARIHHQRYRSYLCVEILRNDVMYRWDWPVVPALVNSAPDSFDQIADSEQDMVTIT